MTKIIAIFDSGRRIMAYRISGPSAAGVRREVENLISDLNPNWGIFTKPIRWGDEYVAHGELVAPEKAILARNVGIDAVAGILETP